MKKTLLLTTAAVLFSFSVQAAPAANQTASAPKETKTIAPYASVKAVYSWEKVKLSDDESPASSTFKAPGLNIAVGAGLGLADIKVKYQDAKDLVSISKTKFAWNLNAGVGFEVAENVTVDVGYRYLQVEEAKKRTFEN